MKSVKHKADESSEHGNNNKRLKSGDEGSLHEEADDLLYCADQTCKSGLPNSGISKLINQSELYSRSVQSASMKVSQNLKIKASSSDSFEENTDGERNTEFVQDYVTKNECDITSPESLQNMDDENETSTNLCLLKAVVSVNKVGSEICIAMAWLEGTCGRDAVHQVMQYLKNNLRIE
ncbi:uncharacterized protein LOC117282456 [Cryptotermes secundus]|uniref:uncharacterized protein LOC117282456 n=1 Tax=Cryptotermes secundus TaxID=105785 RepID=UPI001454CAAE|nr:uncharacterized protein LOC117282456 [Cryptotermes secundus]